MNELYTYRPLRAGENRPEGWILKQLSRDLEEGYIGEYNRVHPTVTKNVFINQDRSSKRLLTPRKEWWSGEHEGYWKDAVVRMAFLTGHKQYTQLAHTWMEALMEHRGKDGYIGIYREGTDPHSRFHHTSGNGELWATSRILMAMLAYHEFTGEPKILEAAETATGLVMKHYRDRNYFINKGKGGGVSHGIGFFEPLEWLYRITGNKAYPEFALKLYDDFNQGRARDDDMKAGRLNDPDRLFHKHGAHVAEGLFVPEMIARLSRSPEMERAARSVLEKLDQHLTPGGAMRCDEFVKGKRGTADERYEYCGIAEMISPFNRMISFSGRLGLADRLERMTFNAGQGARFPVLSALSYLTSDNRIRINHRELGGREAYDAAHFAAVCCALNGARLMPYYVEGMWAWKEEPEKELTALLFGPCRLKTTAGDSEVEIRQETEYPFSDTLRFEFHTNRPAEFTFAFRKPFGVSPVDIQLPKGAVKKEWKDRITIRHAWKSGDTVEARIPFLVEEMDQPRSASVPGKGSFLRRGPLVYALPFEHRIVSKKERGKSGHYWYKIKATDRTRWKYRIPAGEPFEFAGQSLNGEDPWTDPPLSLKGSLVDENQKEVAVSLVPMGTTVFRRVTFPVTYKQPIRKDNS